MQRQQLSAWLRRHLNIALLGGLILAVAACSSGASSQGSKTPTNPIKVALIAPFSGPEGYLGPTALNGIETALGTLGDTVDGRKVQIIKEDDQCTPTNAVTIVQKLLTQSDIAAVFGPICSGSLSATQSLMASHQIVHVTSGYGTNITQVGDKYLFAGVPNSTQLMQALLPYIQSQHPSSVGIMAGNDGFNGELAQVAKAQLSSANIKVSYDTSFDDAATNWSGQIAGFENSGASLLFLTGYEAATGSIIKQFSQQGVKAPIATIVACDPEATQAGAAYVTNAAFALNFCPTYPAFSSFTKEYENRYHSVPTDSVAGAYTTALALLEGLKASGGAGGAALQSAMRHLNYNSSLGKLSYSSNGALANPKIVTGIMQNGVAQFSPFGG